MNLFGKTKKQKIRVKIIEANGKFLQKIFLSKFLLLDFLILCFFVIVLLQIVEIDGLLGQVFQAQTLQ